RPNPRCRDRSPCVRYRDLSASPRQLGGSNRRRGKATRWTVAMSPEGSHTTGTPHVLFLVGGGGGAGSHGAPRINRGFRGRHRGRPLHSGVIVFLDVVGASRSSLFDQLHRGLIDLPAALLLPLLQAGLALRVLGMSIAGQQPNTCRDDYDFSHVPRPYQLPLFTKWTCHDYPD